MRDRRRPRSRSPREAALHKAIERVHRVLSPSHSRGRGSGAGSPRSASPPPGASGPPEHRAPWGVTEVPTEVAHLLDRSTKPRGLPPGDTRMPHELADHLSWVRTQTMTKSALRTIKEDLERSHAGSSPGSPCPSSPSARMPTTHFADEADDVTEPPEHEDPPPFKGFFGVPGHLQETFEDTLRDAVLRSSPVANRSAAPPAPGCFVARNPRYWHYGTQDGGIGNSGTVRSASGSSVWVHWPATGFTTSYEWSLRDCPIMVVGEPSSAVPPCSPQRLAKYRSAARVRSQSPKATSPRRREPSGPSKASSHSPRRTAPMLPLDCGCHGIVLRPDAYIPNHLLERSARSCRSY
ncbi:hypothetical protein DIPPA_19337 [Diplonema papillatum]|nr:hypothetical protein DIPPA_19337 [Diplonema papillatum]